MLVIGLMSWNFSDDELELIISMVLFMDVLCLNCCDGYGVDYVVD